MPTFSSISLHLVNKFNISETSKVVSSLTEHSAFCFLEKYLKTVRSYSSKSSKTGCAILKFFYKDVRNFCYVTYVILSILGL